MNETIESILSRRSIRKFTGEPVSKEDIDTLMKCAMAAPSAGNGQPWHFILIDDILILEKIAKVHPHSSMTLESQFAVLVCGDTSNEKYQGYWVQDCAAATQNMLLGVQGLGLGAVWCGIYPKEERVEKVKELLNLPENIMPLSLIAIGQPNEFKSKSDRYRPDRIHKNKW